MTRDRLAMRLATLTAAATYGLIVLGGLVHNTGSSLACPDWPLCYGEWIPPMQGGILYEHGHRLLASAVGLGIIALLALLWRAAPATREAGVNASFGKKQFVLWFTILCAVAGGLMLLPQSEDFWRRVLTAKADPADAVARIGDVAVQRTLWIALIGLALTAVYGLAWRPAPGRRAAAPPTAPADLSLKCLALLALVLFQGLLGGATVKYRLPFLVSTAHLATSMIVLLTLIYLARASWVRARLAAGPGDESLAKLPQARPAWSLLTVTTLIVYVQIVLGALVRHTGSSEAGGWGLAGAIVPQQAGTGRFIFWPAGAPWPLNAQADLNVLHRYVALLVALAVILCCVRCWTLLGQAFTRVRAMSLVWPVVLVIVQIFAGVLMLALWNVQIYSGLEVSGPAATSIQILARTAHLALGALLLISLFYPTLLLGEAARQE